VRPATDEVIDLTSAADEEGAEALAATDDEVATPDAPSRTAKVAGLALGTTRELTRTTVRLWGSRRQWWGLTPAERRLHTELMVLSGDLTVARERFGADHDAVLASAHRLSEAARQAVLADDPADASALVRASRRQLLELADRRALLSAAAAIPTSTLPEHQSGELIAAVVHVDEHPKARLDPLRGAVVAAQRVHDEAGDGEDRRLQTTARSVYVTGIAAFVLLVVGAVTAMLGNLTADQGEALRNLDNFVAVAGWGLFGAVISRLVPWRQSATPPPAAEFMHPATLMLVRLLTGAIAVIAVVGVLQTDVQSVIAINGSEAYPVALAAGFCERLLDRRLT
jgi:hypothetical protein